LCRLAAESRSPLGLAGALTEATSLDPTEAHPTDPPIRSVSVRPPQRRRGAALIAFTLLALAVAVTDQLLKSWVVANYEINKPVNVVGDWFRIHFIHNSGGLFGILQDSAPIFAVVTVVVVGVLVALEIGSGWRSWLVTVTLGLLLGGAIGNFIDRIQFGYVVDFADIGIGSWRFYIFNIADSAVTVSILLMIVIWFVAPRLGVNASAEEKDDHVAIDDRSDARKVG
jgi:signal peptidase II